MDQDFLEEISRLEVRPEMSDKKNAEENQKNSYQ